jgi:hypothetical protein
MSRCREDCLGQLVAFRGKALGTLRRNASSAARPGL